MKLVVASNNPNKVKEISETLRGSGLVPFSLSQAAVEFGLDRWSKVEETQDTYFGNARLKADAGFSWCRMPVLADDSGIEVDALHGAPGVFSARYGGEVLGADARNSKLLEALEGAAERTARMRTILCAKLGIGQYIVCEGILEGTIAEEPRGQGGWGYEPIFIPTDPFGTAGELAGEKSKAVECTGLLQEEIGLTVAELRDQLGYRGRKVLTHRQRALRNLVALFGSLRHSL